MFALVDCNNFFVSCERVFQPHLEQKPTIVLSNNDGCVIARSNEVKKMGIPMGAPIHKYKHLLKQNNVKTFSCNFQLYGDFSNRVMSTIKAFAEDVQVYSIDEAFINLDLIHNVSHYEYAVELRNIIKQWVGIPTSIGMGPTKTLAKLTNEVAKKNEEFQGVLNYDDYSNKDELLERVEVGDIWGVGRRYAQFLNGWNIYNARQFRDMSLKWVKQNMSINGVRTVMELRGTACFPIHDAPDTRKSILTSRSFGYSVTSAKDMREAVASYVCRAAEKLREEKLAAQYVTVFIKTNKHRQNQQQYSNSYTITLNQASIYNPDLIDAALKALKKIFLDGYYYKKAGVLLTGLVPMNQVQLSFLNDTRNSDQKEKIMHVFDEINNNYGKRTIRYAATGTRKPWSMKQDMRSPRYTTKWSELRRVG
ncbi:Y-family DNA polymerase [Candidatus Dojkabacteria bacterium]|uniref:Y-family DNA polymerase n=1 Tax=Candidatus Dojkabacteria bacterium TaxID=2099670 RepID=A0A955L5F3_9BACT|nr:Y-family DNA polymerase [Candidatus Dojkabacteria bacterium]